MHGRGGTCRGAWTDKKVFARFHALPDDVRRAQRAGAGRRRSVLSGLCTRCFTPPSPSPLAPCRAPQSYPTYTFKAPPCGMRHVWRLGCCRGTASGAERGHKKGELGSSLWTCARRLFAGGGASGEGAGRVFAALECDNGASTSPRPGGGGRATLGFLVLTRVPLLLWKLCVGPPPPPLPTQDGCTSTAA